MSYKVGFRAFGNFSMFTDSFSVVRIQYVPRRLCRCNIIAGRFLQKCQNMKKGYDKWWSYCFIGDNCEHV